MKDISRREALLGTAAVIASAALPSVPATAAPAPEIIPAWVVGTPCEGDWQHIIARTKREALRKFVCDGGYDDFEDECKHAVHQDDCDCCEALADFDAKRIARWDGLQSTTNADWLRAGMGTVCSRCGYEVFVEEGGHAVGDEAVCSDCMKLADWDIVDPERAAEIRAKREPA